ncbi:hypothetical protein Nmel_010563 [Mimus melanotis]
MSRLECISLDPRYLKAKGIAIFTAIKPHSLPTIAVQMCCERSSDSLCLLSALQGTSEVDLKASVSLPAASQLCSAPGVTMNFAAQFIYFRVLKNRSPRERYREDEDYDPFWQRLENIAV